MDSDKRMGEDQTADFNPKVDVYKNPASASVRINSAPFHCHSAYSPGSTLHISGYGPDGDEAVYHLTSNLRALSKALLERAQSIEAHMAREWQG